VLESALAVYPQSSSLWQLLLHIESQNLASSSPSTLSHSSSSTLTTTTTTTSSKSSTRGKRKKQEEQEEVLQQKQQKREEEDEEEEQKKFVSQELWERAKTCAGGRGEAESILLSTLELLLALQATREREGFAIGNKMFHDILNQFSSSHLKCR